MQDFLVSLSISHSDAQFLDTYLMGFDLVINNEIYSSIHMPKERLEK